MTTYRTYIKSDAWRRKRLQIIRRAGGMCEVCRKWPIVNVHHVTYERLGEERPGDLLGVCLRCHDAHHEDQMGRDPIIFERLLSGRFGLRADVDPRDWQIESQARYIEAVESATPSPADEPLRPHTWTIDAGPGSGKTRAVGLKAAYLLNSKRVDQVIFVTPNDSVQRRVREVLCDDFGIDLVRFDGRKHAGGIKRLFQGYTVNYGALLNAPTVHRRLCNSVDTLVVFDEVHHLGDCCGAWGVAADEAFGGARHIICLTGTPYRTDGRRIPFVNYEDVGKNGILRFRADYRYSFGRACAEDVCRKPAFSWHGGRVKIRRAPDEPWEVISFDDDVDEETARLRLRFAVHHTSEARKAMLREALETCRAQRRKVIIFLGGDTEGELTPTEDATVWLPAYLAELGYGEDAYDVVVNCSEGAQDTIAGFGKSDKWILISINMVSEGTDIPELSAAVFLTSITAKMTTIQRIGRCARLMGEDDPHRDMLLYFLDDPRNRELGTEIESEVATEIRLRDRRDRERAEAGEPTRRKTAEGHCFEGGEQRRFTWHGRTFSSEQLRPIQVKLRERGLPCTPLDAARYLIYMEDRDSAA